MSKEDLIAAAEAAEKLTQTKLLTLDGVLSIAEWIATAFSNEPTSASGLKAAIHERKGRCGVRTRLFVEMINSKGGEARVFSIFNRGIRHSAAHVKIDNKWVFIDPMYGAVFYNSNNELLSFDDVVSGKHGSTPAPQLITGYLDRNDETSEAMEIRESKILALYAPKNLNRARSYGFLYDEKTPIRHYPIIDLRKLDPGTTVKIEGAASEILRSSSAEFDAPMPNFLGAANRRVEHEWTINGCEKNTSIRLQIGFFEPPKKPFELSIEVENANLQGESRRFITGERITIDVIPFSSSCKIALRSDFTFWGNKAVFNCLEIGPTSNFSLKPANAESSSDSKKHALDIAARTDKDRLFEFLEFKSPMSRLISSGEFPNYKKRPGNWAWVFHGTSAIFAWRCTEDIRYLEWIFRIFETISQNKDSDLGRIDELRNRPMIGWGALVNSKKYGKKVWINEACTAGCMLMPALLAACEAASNADLFARYEDIIRNIIEVSSEVLAEFEDDIRDIPGAPQSYMVMPHDGEAEPTAHVAPYAVSVAALSWLTGDHKRRDLAQRLANYFKASISEECGVWTWPYRPLPNAMHGHGEFFFKARVTMIMPIHCYCLGMFFNRSDLSQFASTFTKAVLRDKVECYSTVSLNNGKPIRDGLLEKYRAKGRLSSLAQIAGFYPLSAFDSSVGNKIELFVAQNPELFPKGWFSTPSTIEAYAVRINTQKAMRLFQQNKLV